VEKNSNLKEEKRCNHRNRLGEKKKKEVCLYLEKRSEGRRDPYLL